MSARLSQQFLEGSAELDVEDGVDDRVEEAVDIAEPDKEREQDRVDGTGADDVDEVVA